MDEQSYAKHPESLTEARAKRSHNAGDWTPRDVLVSLLREIDSGTLDLDTLVVAYRGREDRDDMNMIGHSSSSQDVTVTIGLLERAKVRVMASLGDHER